MRSPFPCWVLTGLLLTGCRGAEPARVGNAYPPTDTNSELLAAIRPAVESTGVLISTWSITGPTDATIQLNTEQATVFADDPSVVGVVGHPGSRDALLGAAVYNERGVPHVVPNATSSMLAKAGPWTFTLVPGDSVEGAFIAHYALDSLRASRMAVLYVGDEYGIGLRDGVRGALLRRGTDLMDAAIIPSDFCFEEPLLEVFTSIVKASLRRARPDVMVVTTGSINGWCVADLIHAESPSTWILFGDGMDGAHTIPEQSRGVVADRIRAVEFWSPGKDSLNAAFVQRIQRVLKRAPGASEALQYDAFMVLSAAVREAGANREAVRGWLESLGRTRDPWPGVTGPIAFNRSRNEIMRMSGPTGTAR